MEFHWIFAGVLILCFIWLFKFLKKTSKRCSVCRESVLSFDTLEESRRDALVNILEKEGVQLHQLEICPKCSRIYDEGWLSEKWILEDRDMSNRYCECGDILKIPWDIDPPILKKIMTGLPPQIVQSLIEETSREDVARLLDGYRVRSSWTSFRKRSREEVTRLLGGYHDILYRNYKLSEGHALRVCDRCFRVYMWVQKGDVQLFNGSSTGQVERNSN